MKCCNACILLKCAASTGVGITGVGIAGVGITGVGIAGVGITGVGKAGASRDYHAICCMDGKTIQCLPNPSQHVPIYLQ